MEPETITKVKTDLLRLDRLNPRLLGESRNESDEAIIARLYRAAELDELLQSISANGYMDIEPLVVMSDPNNSGFIVLEGNRRLATLRLLQEPELVRKIEKLEGLKIRIPGIMNISLKDTFKEVSVYRVNSREDARAFIGFKHINGLKKWDAYAKARYAAEWYKSNKDSQQLEYIAQSIGDRHDTVKRMVYAIYVLEQAREEDLFYAEDRYHIKFSFSHLYTALSRSQYMKYIGLDLTWRTYDPSPDPIPKENLNELRKILVWIYGSKKDDLPPVVKRQNPDIKRLGEVIAHPQGLHVLEVTGNLDYAHDNTKPIDSHLTASLINARKNIREAAGSLRAYDGRDKSLLDIAEDVKETAESVYSRMAKKHREITILI